MVKRVKHHWITPDRSGQFSPGQERIPLVPAANLIGAPDDRGVLNVGGRLGAGLGPQAARELLSQFMLGIEGAVGRIELRQGFDIDPGPSIEAGHAAVRRAVCADLKAGVTPIVLGGGHDYGFPHLAGAADALAGKIAVINVDAHLDLRPPGPDGITSGSPFYLALEEGAVKPQHLVELGIQEHCNDESFYAYARKKRVRIIGLDEARKGRGPAACLERLVVRFAKMGLKTVVSFDVDAVQMAHAPGVSAPQSDGLSPADLFAMARYCGRSRDVATVGFFELAPPLDENQRTARLVATAIHRFLSGFSLRGERKSRSRGAIDRLRRLPPFLKATDVGRP